MSSRSVQIRISKGTTLGKGENGDVYQGEWKGNAVAVKRIKSDQVDPKYKNYVDILKNIDHENITKLFFVEYTKKHK